MAREPLPPPQPPPPRHRSFRGAHPKKRKRPAEGDGSGAGDATATATTISATERRPKAKKQKKDKKAAQDGEGGDRPAKASKKKQKQADNDADIDYDLGINRAFARMDAAALAAHLARQTKRFGTDLSVVELADLAVDAAAVRDTSAFAADRTLAHLPDFLAAHAAPRAVLTTAPSAPGAPHTIVVTGAGLRAADLVRALRPLQTKTSAVAKLFAKHIKLAESVAFLQSHRTGIAVGTPARLIDLLDHGALSVAHLRWLVVDASHIDQKKRGVLDMQDTALPLARWLARPEFRARYATSEGGEGGEGGQSQGAEPLEILFY